MTKKGMTVKTSDFDPKNAKSLMYLDKFLKIIAGQKLNISYDSKAETAYFVPRTNSIVLPTYIFQSKNLFVRFGTHEVAHALYTPKNFYSEHNKDSSGNSREIVVGSKKFDINPVFFSCINIVEDIRIERKIRQDFPGLVQPYKRSAEDLAKTDTWAPVLNCTYIEWKNLSIADKINLKSKFKHYIQHDLTDVEYAVLKYVSNTKTFDDVVIRANYLYSLLKIEEQKRGQGENSSNEQNGQPSENSSSGSPDSSGKKSQSSNGNSSNSSNLPPELTQDDLDAAAQDAQTMSSDELNDMLETLKENLDAIDKSDILEQQFDDKSNGNEKSNAPEPDSREAANNLMDALSKATQAQDESDLDSPDSNSISTDLDTTQQDKFKSGNSSNSDLKISGPSKHKFGDRTFTVFV